MTLDIAAIAKTALLIGADLPAYKGLFDQVVAAFHADPAKQAELKQTYEDAMAQAQKAHDAAQSI